MSAENGIDPHLGKATGNCNQIIAGMREGRVPQEEAMAGIMSELNTLSPEQVEEWIKCLVKKPRY